MGFDTTSAVPGTRTLVPASHHSLYHMSGPTGKGLTFSPEAILTSVNSPRLSQATVELTHGRQDSNLQPAVLETAALPIAPLPYAKRTTRQGG